MPSANKTPNIGLNKWEGNEYLKRQDLVDDNTIIDTKIKENADALAAHKAEKATNDKLGHIAGGVHFPINSDGRPALKTIYANNLLFPNSVSPALDLSVVGAVNTTHYWGMVFDKTGYPSNYGTVFGFVNSANGYRYSWQLFTGPDAKILYKRYALNSDAWSPWYKIITDESDGWVDATLENGWTGELKYKRDALGCVTLMGKNLKPGVSAGFTRIGILPSSVSPYAPLIIPVYKLKSQTANYDGTAFYIDNAGHLRLPTGQVHQFDGDETALYNFIISYGR